MRVRSITAFLVTGFGVISAEAASACRLPVDPEARERFREFQKAETKREADIVVDGMLISPAPDCMPSACGKRILLRSLVKGDAQQTYILSSGLMIDCQPHSTGVGDIGRFYLKKTQENEHVFVEMRFDRSGA